MKTIGLIGGMSWESTLDYYRIMNRTVREKLGGFHSAKLVLYSVDFDELHHLQERDEYGGVAQRLAHAARTLEGAGADFLLIGANTMHMHFDAVSSAVRIPLLHIGDVTGEAIVARGLKRVGLLGTTPTMELDFYKSRLASRFGLDVLVPDEAGRKFVHRVIVSELCHGRFLDGSRARFLEIIDSLVQGGAEGVILGCTEIPLLVKQADTDLPLFNTTELHARRAVELALE